MTDTPPAQLTTFSASHGAGELVQRDYWAPLPGCSLAPEDLLQRLVAEFPHFANPAIASFSFVQPPPLEVGHEMKIEIRGYGTCHVRVVRKDERSLTLRTLEDHFEAGRITFGAWCENGSLIFKIRSRARIRSKLHLLGFIAGGHLMQTALWVQFVRNVAESCGAAIDEVQQQNEEVKATLADMNELDTPTFIA